MLGSLLLCGPGLQAEPYRIPLFVSATPGNASQGVLRVLNRSDASGIVSVYAIDDAGMRSGPVMFTLAAQAAAEFDAADLANGNAIKGLSGSLGNTTINRRLEIITDLHVEPLAFVQSADGTLAVMHDAVRETVDGARYRYEVPIFNPSSNVTQASRLRLINPGDAVAAVTIGALDDTGAAATGGEVQLTVPGGGARTLSAQQLEAGDLFIMGRLGAGVGRWRLRVSADRPIQVVNVSVNPTGEWNNLSTSAVRGPAPVDHAAFTERFDGLDVVYETDNRRLNLAFQPEDRYSETGQVDGVMVSMAGSHRYRGLGPDAGRLRLIYDNGDECQANYHFASRFSGWFASRCTDGGNPEGRWLAGDWFIDDGVDTSPVLDQDRPGDHDYRSGAAIDTLTLPAATGGDGILRYSLSPDVPGLNFDATTRQLSGTPSEARRFIMTYTVTDDDGDTDSYNFTITVVSSDAVADAVADGECHVDLVLGIGESCIYPGTDDAFSVNERGRGAFLSYLAGIRIRVENETVDGRVYDLVASHQGDGVWRIERVAGSTEPPTADTSPTFGSAPAPEHQNYTVGTAIDALLLPAASGGDGELTYSLSPDVPGLSFDGTILQLTGTPSVAGSYAMTYTVTDSDGDADTRTFSITVGPSDAIAEGDCYVGLTMGSGDSCTYPDTEEAFSVDEQGRGSFLSLLADVTIRINVQSVNGRAYDFAASHQGDGVWRIERVAGSTDTPTDDGDMGTGEEVYRGIRVAPENRCSEYDSDDYSYPRSVEDRIVAGIGKIYGPYTGQCFDSTGDTDIEHIVARSEAHDSGMCAASAATKRTFARDLLNLTLASPSVNRFQKSDNDVAEWLPSLNACWYVARTLEVRRKYDLTIDRREADATERVLSMCASTDMIVQDCDTQPQRPLALVLYDDNGNGRITCAEARAHGIAPVHRGHIAYPYMDDRDNDGVVCE